MTEADFVVCETIAAVTTHLRVVSSETAPVQYGGHRMPRPLALCDAEIAWDTKLPLTAARCMKCRAASGLNIWPGFEHR